QAAESSLRAAVQHAVRAGELLLEAKRIHGQHGQWTSWLQENIDFSDRLAQAYMRLARLPLEKRNAVADLPVRKALSAIRSRERPIADDQKGRNRDASKPVSQESAGIREVTVPPRSPPVLPQHIAGDLIGQLEQASYEASDEMTVGDLCGALDRRTYES